jgi:hypothetical protein
MAQRRRGTIMAEEYKFILGGEWITVKAELLGEFLRELKKQKTGKAVGDKGLDKKAKKK